MHIQHTFRAGESTTKKTTHGFEKGREGYGDVTLSWRGDADSSCQEIYGAVKRWIGWVNDDAMAIFV